MAVKMRLSRIGKKKGPFYRIVVCDSRAPQRGRYVDLLGTYDPLQEPSKITIDHDKVTSWLSKGAQPTVTVKRLLKITGYYSEPKLDSVNARNEV
ncbi:MAG: 30S ribosomal protein S16 [Candidatus Coatesbacteria bacterium]|nr:30S ribosomal protein S16 [Candidatus Coatesbacteria bacterium]